MARELTIRIKGDDSDWKATAGGVDRDIAGISQRAQVVGGQLTSWGKALLPVSLAVGAIGTGIVALAKRGGGVGDVTEQFESLSIRVNETAGTMLGALRKGTQGTVADFALMKSANLAMGNGLRANAGEMEILASGAKLAADRIGGDTVAAYDVLTGAINKGSTAKLKQIGLYVDEEAALQVYAASIGTTVAKLNEQQESAAIQAGVLAALRVELDSTSESQGRVGNALDGAAVRFTNMIDRVSVMAANSEGLADVVDIVTSGLGMLLTVVETVAGWFAKIPAPIQSVVVVLGGLIAAAAPVLIIVGQLITAFGAILPLFAAGTTGAGILAGAITLLTGPVGLVIAAVVGLIAIWTTWGDDIKRIVSEAYTAVKTWLWDKLEPVLTPIIGLVQSIMAMFQAFNDLVGAIAAKIFFWVVDKIAAAFNVLWDVVTTVVGAIGRLLGKVPDWLLPILGPVGLVIAAFRHWDEIKAIVLAVYTAVKTYLLDKFTAIVDGIKGKIDAVTGFFKDMYTKVVGGSYVPDMMDGIEYQFGPRLQQVMVAPSLAATAAVAESFFSLQGQLGGILQSLVGSLSGGGGIGGMVKGAFGEFATGFLSGIVDSFVPGLSTILGPVLSKVGGKVVSFISGLFGGGNDTKKDREKLAGLLGFSSLDGLYSELRGMGEEGQRLVEEGLNKIGKKDKAANAEWLQSVQALFATYKDEAMDAGKSIRDSIGGALSDVVRRFNDMPSEYEFDVKANYSGFGSGGPGGSGTSYAAAGGWVTPQGVKYYDTGGWVRKGSDSVRAMLTPGEFVVSRKGVAALSALNQGNAGGIFNGKAEQRIQVFVGEDVIVDAAFKGLPAKFKVHGVANG